jgi:hypothetical protein
MARSGSGPQGPGAGRSEHAWEEQACSRRRPAWATADSGPWEAGVVAGMFTSKLQSVLHASMKFSMVHVCILGDVPRGMFGIGGAKEIMLLS